MRGARADDAKYARLVTHRYYNGSSPSRKRRFTFKFAFINHFARILRVNEFT